LDYSTIDRAFLTKIYPAQASLDLTKGSTFSTKNRADTPAPTLATTSVNTLAPTPATSLVYTLAPTSSTSSATTSAITLAYTVCSKVTDSLNVNVILILATSTFFKPLII